METINGITFGFGGEELKPWQAMHRLMNAGFPIQGGVLLTMFAIVEGESGSYQRAWNLNVERYEDDTILRYTKDDSWPGGYKPVPFGTSVEPGTPVYMKVKSIDLGFCQFNKPVNEFWLMNKVEVADKVTEKFEEFPELANPHTSAVLAYGLWLERGFSPWYAWVNRGQRPDAWRIKKRYGAIGLAQCMVNLYVGKDPETGKNPTVQYKPIS